MNYSEIQKRVEKMIKYLNDKHGKVPYYVDITVWDDDTYMIEVAHSFDDSAALTGIGRYIVSFDDGMYRYGKLFINSYEKRSSDTKEIIIS